LHPGILAERTAEKCKVSRKDQDGYAIETYKRANEAIKGGKFKNEIAPATVCLFH